MARKMETSKKIAYISDASAISLSAAVVYGCLNTGNDMSSLATVTAAAWVECGAANAFYFWKAKNENRSKYAMRLVKDLADKYGIDAVTHLTEIVLKD